MLQISGKIIKKVGVDFDGVILGLFMSREWSHKFGSGKNTTTNTGPNNNVLKITMKLNELIRNKREGVNEGLAFIKNNVEKIYLVSSRNTALMGQTTNWLIRNNLNIFDECYLNKDGLNPTDFKVSMVNKLQLDMFIDDNFTTARTMASVCPTCEVLNIQNKNTNVEKSHQENYHSFNSWTEIIEYLK